MLVDSNSGREWRGKKKGPYLLQKGPKGVISQKRTVQEAGGISGFRKACDSQCEDIILVSRMPLAVL